MTTCKSLASLSFSTTTIATMTLALSFSTGCMLDGEDIDAEHLANHEQTASDEYFPADEYSSSKLPATGDSIDGDSIDGDPLDKVTCVGGKYTQFNYPFIMTTHPDCPGSVVYAARAITRCCSDQQPTSMGGTNNFAGCGGQVPPRWGDTIFNACNSTCGDSVVDDGEQCDDGGASADCTDQCVWQYPL